MNKDVKAHARLVMRDDNEVKGFMEKWHAYVDSPDLVEEIARRQELADTYGSMTSYLQKNWLSYHERFVKYYVDQHLHLGIHSTSPVEKQNDLIKHYQGYCKVNFQRFFKSYKDLMDHQNRDINDEIAEHKTRTPTKALNIPMFQSIYRRVSHLALDKAMDELVKAKNGKPPTDIDYHSTPYATLQECTGYMNRCFGVPCAHIMKSLMISNQRLQLHHFNDHWILPPRVIDRMQVNETICIPCGPIQPSGKRKGRKSASIDGLLPSKKVGRGRIESRHETINRTVDKQLRVNKTLRKPVVSSEVSILAANTDEIPDMEVPDDDILNEVIVEDIFNDAQNVQVPSFLTNVLWNVQNVCSRFYNK